MARLRRFEQTPSEGCSRSQISPFQEDLILGLNLRLFITLLSEGFRAAGGVTFGGLWLCEFSSPTTIA
jgi:hypothetical protein